MFTPHAALILGLTFFALILFTLFSFNNTAPGEFDKPLPQFFADTPDDEQEQ